MEGTRYREIRAEDEELNSQRSFIGASQLQLPRFKQHKWWFQVFLYTSFIIVGESAATLLGRFYFDSGGNSKWIAAFVQEAGFPIWIPFLFFSRPSTKPQLINAANKNDPPRRIPSYSLLLMYLFFGIFFAVDDLLYSYGLLYLPVSTYSLISATQLAFNAVFSFLLNSQKFTALILNSVVLLTISASLLAVHPDSTDSTIASEGNYIIGFLCTLAGSAMYSLGLSLIELSFQKFVHKETFYAVLDMQIYPSLVATCVSLVGLFVSGEWKTLPIEMQNYKKGQASYVLTLFWNAISWNVSSLGLFGLIFEVSSLFSNVIDTVPLPVIPVLGVIFFHDKVDGVKIIALILAIFGFLSYMYQHYLDDANVRKSLADEEDCSTLSLT
ncbi:OLC1v1031495C1 [Oldenlandia corymbosa var. corymbosa]|uniref:Probable purine permease n=1 Tax=Oldenlandia corymbosa var. corymbosa TaxID=529605 RepID=A0AAV1CKI5_OLDCO|nr:OLC1v1031495C1 [Oldenlandia corymbosa var. corymbosa]